MIKLLAKRIIKSFGFEIRRVSNDKTMTGALRRLSARGVEPNSVIDLGAASGEWTRLAKAIFPKCRVLMIEPLVENEKSLRDLSEQVTGVTYELAAAGGDSQSVVFDVTDDLDGSGVYGGGSVRTRSREVPQVTLNDMIVKHKLQGPYLLKFDCHGYEVQILRGAHNVLNDTCAIIMECYTFPVSPTAELFWNMCSRMQQLGFRPADMVDLLWRPPDKMLWQFDLIFLRSDRQEFQNANYK
jgi:FkbM family methyltransferase